MTTLNVKSNGSTKFTLNVPNEVFGELNTNLLNYDVYGEAYMSVEDFVSNNTLVYNLPHWVV